MSNSVNFYEFIGFITFNLEVHELVNVYRPYSFLVDRILVSNVPHACDCNRNRNRNRKLQTSKAPLKSQAQGTSLFTSAASNQVFSNSPWEAQVRLPEGERMHQIRGVFQRIVRGKLRSGCQILKVRE